MQSYLVTEWFVSRITELQMFTNYIITHAYMKLKYLDFKKGFLFVYLI